VHQPNLALYESEAFELLCFSCNVGGGSESNCICGCVDALFYIACKLQASHLQFLVGFPGCDSSLSVEHNAIIFLRSVRFQRIGDIFSPSTVTSLTIAITI
jgi:hypothetical protein